MRRFHWLLLGAMVFTACDENRIYEKFVKMSEYWHQDEVISFEFEIENDSLPYDLIAQFKQDIDFPNYNFYFSYQLIDESDSVLEENLEETLFFEPKTGEPLGSGIGDTFDHEHVLKDNFRFPGPGTYEVTFRQFMRVDSIPHILRVGLRVENASAD